MIRWREIKPPVIPIYFIEYGHLKDFLDRGGEISEDGLEAMLDYFVEFEEFEKAALVRDALADPETGHETKMT